MSPQPSWRTPCTGRWRARVIAAGLAVIATAAPRRAEPRPLGQVAFRTFGTDDGLTNLVVLAVTEDAEGALWIGTDDGLFRLDGERAVRVAAGSALPSQHVHTIAATPDGELCVGLDHGLWCGRGGALTAVELDGDVAALASAGGALWIATNQGLFVRRDARPPVRVDPGLAGPVSYLWADAQGVVVGRGAALAAAGRDGAWAPLALSLGPDGAGVREVRRDGRGALWLRSVHHLWRVAPGRSEAEDVTGDLPEGNGAWSSQQLSVAPDGALVVATDGGVVTLRDGGRARLDRAHGLPTDAARIVYFDRAGDLWVGSTGVHRRLGRGLIERFTPATGLPGDTVWSIARTTDGALLAGTNHCLAEPAGDRWACVEGTAGRFVRAIAATPDGGAYFAGAPPAIYRRAPDGTVSELARLAPGGDGAHVLALHLAADGALWIGTDGGLWRRSPAGGAPARVIPPGGDPRRFISAIAGDAAGTWFAGHEGLRLYDGEAWRRFTIDDGLRATAVRYVVRRRDGRVCVLYDQGLGVTCFRYAGGALRELRHVADAEGLEPAMAYSIGEDLAGRLWLGTGAGLRVLTDEPGAPIDRFTARDGLAGDDSAAMAFLLDPGGELWFGASGGLSRVAAPRYAGPPAPPVVRILSVAGGAVPAAGSGARRGEPPGHRELRARFVANAYVDADVEYRARLLPHDPAWTEAGSRELHHAALGPGDYQLEVAARWRGGRWGPVTRASFTIPPAWWEEPWLWLTAGAIGVAATAGLVLAWQRASLRRRTRALAAQTDASFRAFVASMPDVVIVRRADGGVYSNAAARAVLGGHDAHSFLQLARAVHPDDRRRAVASFRRGATSGPGEAAELLELRIGHGGDWRDLEVTLQAITLAGAGAHVLVGRDVTERRRLHARMQIADRMVSLGTLAAGIGHEINNPLTYVRANLELIGELAADDRLASHPAELDRALRDALDGADRVRAIVRGLATFSHAASELRVEVALRDVVEQAARLTGNELRHRARLVITGDAPPPVLGDPRRLTQVAINLLINAAHAFPPGAADRNQITVRTARDPATGHAVLEVEDHGVGMAPEVVARVFDPFFTTKRIGEGTGLGLSICHGIVTALGGQITVDSQLGHGTTVRISLPPSAPTAAPPPAAPRPIERAGPARPRVLVIDDEPQVGGAIGRMLQRASCEVTVLTDGEDALRRVTAGERYDVIVTDVMMPVMTGLELHERLLAIAPDQGRRVVFVTGGAFNPATAAQLEQLDAPRLDKPFSAEALRRTVREVAAAGAAP